MYMVIDMNSDFERAIRNEEIEELEEQKPELLLSTVQADMFHPDYTPPPTIKKEPLDPAYQ